RVQPDFFFQAEDGIRDLIVTGVQTCALPILTISISVPSFERGIGTHAYPMFFFSRGDLASAVRIPISFPSFRTGHGCGSQGRTKIGRASCREGVSSSVEAGVL